MQSKRYDKERQMRHLDDERAVGEQRDQQECRRTIVSMENGDKQDSACLRKGNDR